MTMKSIVLQGGIHNGEKMQADVEDNVVLFDETPAYEGESIVDEKGEFTAKGVGRFSKWEQYKRTGQIETHDSKEFEVFEFHSQGEAFRDVDGFLYDKPGGERIK